MKYDLIAATDQFMVRPQFRLHGPVHFYPSEASVKWTDSNGLPRVSGSCLRKNYLRLTGEAPGRPFDAYTQWIFSLGKAVEEILVEQWKQMGIWVANNVKFYDRERNISGEVDVVLRDPVNDEVFIVECCTPDTLILNSDYRLSKFSSGEIVSVVGHKAYDNLVKNIQIKRVENENVYKFQGKYDGLFGEFTGEHPILTANIITSRYIKDNKKRTRHFKGTEYKKASEVCIGDYICIPKARFGSDTNQEIFSKYEFLVDGTTWKFIKKDKSIYSIRYKTSRYHHIPSHINNLKDFYWLLGLYLAEGSCSNYAVYFSLHKEEEDIINKIRKITKNLFGLDITVRNLKNNKTKMGNGVNVSIHSKAVRELFKTLVPGNTRDKTKYLQYNRILNKHEFLEQILWGAIAGDGCKLYKAQHRITTAVASLAFLYFQLAAYCGFHPRLKKYKQASNFNSEYIYAVEFSEDMTGLPGSSLEKLIDIGDLWCYKVKKIKTREYTGIVYNLECSQDHTYTAGGIIVHNCKSYAGYQATRSIMGNSKVSAAPKTSQMLQAIIYVDQCKDRVDYVKMVYYARDSGYRNQFDIRLIEDNGVMRPTVNGVIDYRFTLSDIYDRYEELKDCLERRVMPNPDFELVWDDKKVELKNQLGEISKSGYEKWKKNKKSNPLGDWECRYCGFSDYCYKK